jgi:hypothetical protein
MGVAPAIIADQTTECVATAINSRIGNDFLFNNGMKRPKRSQLIIGTDTHRALVRLAKHFAGQCMATADHIERTRIDENIPLAEILGRIGLQLSTHARCMLHMLFACLARQAWGGLGRWQLRGIACMSACVCLRVCVCVCVCVYVWAL